MNKRQLKYKIKRHGDPKLMFAPFVLKIDDEITILANVKRKREIDRNEALDAVKKLKRDKTIASQMLAAKLKEVCDSAAKDIAQLEQKIDNKVAEAQRLSAEATSIRAELYVFGDCLYNALLTYREFLRKYCKAPDDPMAATLSELVEKISALPFEFDQYESHIITAYGEICDAVIDDVEMDILHKFDELMK